MAMSNPLFAILRISVSLYVRVSVAVITPSTSSVFRAPKYNPPVSSRMIIISNPSPIISSRSGHASFNSSYKYAGLKFANKFKDFLNFNNPASGLNSGANLYHGEVAVLPPMEPISTASDAFAAAIASSVNGTPVASIEHPPIKIASYKKL